jgi:hypothetical protein
VKTYGLAIDVSLVLDVWCTEAAMHQSRKPDPIPLGLTAADAEELKSALLAAAESEEAVPGENDEYGWRFALIWKLGSALHGSFGVMKIFRV